MNELYKLRETLCDELKDYGKGGGLSEKSVAMVDTLAHAVKNIDKIIDWDDGGYSSRPYDTRYYRDGGSYARKRDSMGRYSRHGSIAERLRDMVDDAPESAKRELERLADKMEQM